METKLFGSPPVFWRNLIRYQVGAVVSRELYHKSGGTITLFAFDKGQGLSEHQTPFDAFVQILDGKAEISIDGISCHLKKGEFLLMPSGHPHKVIATEKCIMLLTMIKS